MWKRKSILHVDPHVERLLKMNPRDFCYWLQGLFELGKPVSLDAEQTELIRRHLNMVFAHEIDPSFPPELQETLTALHEGKPVPATDLITANPTPPSPWKPEPLVRC